MKPQVIETDEKDNVEIVGCFRDSMACLHPHCTKLLWLGFSHCFYKIYSGLLLHEIVYLVMSNWQGDLTTLSQEFVDSDAPSRELRWTKKACNL
jgi:hypothetical protein